MGTRTDDSVDWIIRTLFLEDALGKSKENWSKLLPEIGVDTIVLHRDWFSTVDLETLDIVLNQWFGTPNIESESGHIQIWTLDSKVAEQKSAKENLLRYFPEFR